MVIFKSALTTAELVAVCVEPAKCAIPAPGEEATTQVAHVRVKFAESAPPPPSGEDVLTFLALVTGTNPQSAIIPPVVPLIQAPSLFVLVSGPMTRDTLPVLSKTSGTPEQSTINIALAGTVPVQVPELYPSIPLAPVNQASAGGELPLEIDAAVTEPGVLIFPLESIVAVAEGV